MKKYSLLLSIAIFTSLWVFPQHVILFAGEVDLPKTGQTTCYDEDSGVIDCAGTGQDGDIQAGVEWPSPRFTDNNDGTVTDNLTGLMWLKDANCFGDRTWQMALVVVTDINKGPLTYNCSDYTANYDDWRLPNVVELESLVNAEKSNSAAWLNTQGFTNLASSPFSSDNYWSATAREWSAYTKNYYFWVVGMSSSRYVDYEWKSNRCYVWPVRGGQSGPAQTWQTGQTTSYAAGDDGDLQRGVSWPAPRFEDNGNGTITDHLTGLIWLKKTYCFGRETWSQALADCNNLASESCGLSDGSVAGDWRLPNRKELLSLIDYSRYHPALPQGHPFEIEESLSWSTTTYGSFSYGTWYGSAWTVSIYSGGVGLSSMSSSHQVWAVRAGQGGILGYLTVTIEPYEARSAGAQWRVDGGVWHDSGYTQSGLAPGNHTLEFSTIDGWSRPSNQQVMIVENQTSQVSATYSSRATAMPWIPLLLFDN